MATTWYYRDLLINLISRDVRLQYRRSVLGVLWSLINPLVSMLVFIFLFQGVLHFHVPHYAVYVFSGLLAWTWFSASLSGSTYCLIQSRDLVRKPMFPTQILVLVTVSSNLVNYILSLPLLFGLLVYDGVPISPLLLLLPFALVMQALFTAGLSYVISVLNVHYRDVEHLVAVGLGMWFYLTPIFYQRTGASDKYSLLFYLNPMTHFVGFYRAIFLTHQFPGYRSLLGILLLSVFVFVAGYVFYSKTKFNVVDEL